MGRRVGGSVREKGRSVQMSRTNLLQQLRRAPALRRLPDAQLESLAAPSRVRELAPGEAIFEEADPGGSAYLIVEGCVTIHKQIDRELSVPVALRGPGEWIGEMALLEDAARSASAVVESRVRVLEIPRREFLAILQEVRDGTQHVR